MLIFEGFVILIFYANQNVAHLPWSCVNTRKHWMHLPRVSFFRSQKPNCLPQCWQHVKIFLWNKYLKFMYYIICNIYHHLTFIVDILKVQLYGTSALFISHIYLDALLLNKVLNEPNNFKRWFAVLMSFTSVINIKRDNV